MTNSDEDPFKPKKTLPHSPRVPASGSSITEPSCSNSRDSTSPPNLTLQNRTLTSPTAPEISYYGDEQKNIQQQQNNTADFENYVDDIHLNDESQEEVKPEENIMAVPLSNSQIVGLKDALKCVPTFIGEPGTFYRFAEGCEEAKDMIEDAAEENLVKMIKGKIDGEAKKTLRGQAFTTVAGLVDHLREIYFTTKPLYQLYGDLAKLHQQPGERVVNFGNRVREILQKICDTYKKENNSTNQQMEDFKNNLQPTAIETFKRGLQPEIEQRMAVARTLVDAIKDAVKVERYLQEKEELHLESIIRKQQQMQYRRHTYPCQICEENHDAKVCPVFTDSQQKSTIKDENSARNVFNTKQETVCQICDKAGHSAKDCYQRQKKEANKEAPTCQFCDKKGHEAKNCYKIKPPVRKTTAIDRKNLICGKCKNKGHSTEKCFLDVSKKCTFCDRFGHLEPNCKAKTNQATNSKN